MAALVVYSHREEALDPTIDSGKGGGRVDDILRRLGNVEAGVAEVKADVAGIKATLPHLATKADVEGVRTEIANLRGELKRDIALGQRAMIQWTVGTVIAMSGLMFSVAKYVH